MFFENPKETDEHMEFNIYNDKIKGAKYKIQPYQISGKTYFAIKRPSGVEWRVKSHALSACCYQASQFLCFGSWDGRTFMLAHVKVPAFGTIGPHPLYKMPQQVRGSQAYFYI